MRFRIICKNKQKKNTSNKQKTIKLLVGSLFLPWKAVSVGGVWSKYNKGIHAK